MAWIYLIIAGLFEVGFAVSLKYSQGFTRLWPSLASVATGLISLWFLSLSIKTLPVGTAYAVWTGIGAFGSVLIGMIFFQEPREMLRIFFLLCIVIGVIGLQVTSPS